jgi:competence protein ComFC
MILIVSKLIEDFLGLFFSAGCLVCSERSKDLICRNCLSDFMPVEFPICRLCGIPLPVVNNDDHMICELCRFEPPTYTLCRSVLRYEGKVKESILKMKMEGRTELAPVLTGIINRYIDENKDLFDVDIIVPVPKGGAKTKISVGSATLLCLHFKTGENIPVINALKRVRKTRAQSSLNYEERWKNVENAFDVENPLIIKGKRILLADDIFTSGATVSNCTNTLLENGALEVKVLTLARAGLVKR